MVFPKRTPHAAGQQIVRERPPVIAWHQLPNSIEVLRR
jgi:hypothetical protein